MNTVSYQAYRFSFFFFRNKKESESTVSEIDHRRDYMCIIHSKEKQKLPENSLTNLTGIKRNGGSLTSVSICSASHFTVFLLHRSCICVVITMALHLLTAQYNHSHKNNILGSLFLLHLKLIDYLMCSIKNSPCLVSSLQVGGLGARLHMLPQQVYVARVS